MNALDDGIVVLGSIKVNNKVKVYLVGTYDGISSGISIVLYASGLYGP